MAVKSGLLESIWRFAHRGTLVTDDDTQRIRKAVVTLVATTIAVLAVAWGSLYIVIGYPWSGAIPLSYAVISFLSIVYFFHTRRFQFFRVSQLALVFLLPFLLQWSLGGFVNGSVVMIWAFFAPLAALLFAQPNHASKWLIAYLVATVLSAVLMVYPLHSPPPMSPGMNILLFVLNMGCGSVLIFVLVGSVMRDREQTMAGIQETKILLEQANRKLQENEAVIRDLMMTDTLTGIANRRYLDERLANELGCLKRQPGKLTVVMTDIDYFKNINDELGHAAGDQVLVGFARLLKQGLRGCDFVARYGGEEFIILLPDTTAEGAKEFVSRIQAELKQRPIPPLTKPITTSFGVTEALENESACNLLERVDRAMYRSKHEGRDRTTVV